MGGNLEREGIVEVRISGANNWGSVCAAGWDISDANILCRQLGYPSAEAAYTNSEFGASTGGPVMSNFRCSGSEEVLPDCPHTNGVSSCVNYAGVRCSPKGRH